ncbi:hypothetical protein LRS74_18765 [Streptomyces sp. LX-29]|uniref:hypothetical protein n=1 Tax=Streptomyces sp. LX-29 TaxID=2900152 RepID=UPI00240D976C|nr:hypothetical protein [Streptomyces sp. LX-29]WFB08857.1 hypothetical protein LRS74_18765 [Streptomyces sp. LX-29]
MGIESDRLVYDYLSRVGDLAQQQGLPSRDRMRLVATLRARIDESRAGAGAGGDSAAGVKRILGRLGTPTEVVAQAEAGVRARAVSAPEPSGGVTPSAAAGSGTPSADGVSPRGAASVSAAAAMPKAAGRGVTAEAGRASAHASEVTASEATVSEATAWQAAAPRGAAAAAGAATPPDASGRYDARPRYDDAPVPQPPTVPAPTVPTSPTGPATPTAPRESAESQAPGGMRKAGRTARERLAGLAERSGLGGLGGKVVPPREGAAPVPAAGVDAPRTASPPHLAGEDELSSRESNPDWWRTEPGPFSPREDVPFGQVDGFSGGIELPELLKPPSEQREKPEREADAEAAAGAGDGASDGRSTGGGGRGLLRRTLRRRTTKADGAPRGSLGPLLLLAVALLVAGAVMANVLVLAFGWLIAYYTPRLTPGERKAAVFGVPGTVALGAMVWLWGRLNERWGAPIPEHGLGDAVQDAWPVVVRAAAVASALFLIWRARRRTPA